MENYTEEENKINPEWLHQVSGQAEPILPEHKLKDKLRLYFKQPWLRSLMISLIIVIVGGSISYAYYRQGVKKIEQDVGMTMKEVSTQLETPNADNASVTGASSVETSEPTTPAVPPSSNTSTNQTTSNDTTNSSSPITSPSTGQTKKTINDNALELKAKSYGYCSALAPEDWSFTANAEATGADIWAPDSNYHAGWGIAFAYSAIYPTEESFINSYLKLIFNTQNVSLTSSAVDAGYGYSKRDYAGRTDRDFKGTVYYQKYDAPELGGYIIVTRSGTTEASKWDSMGGVVQSAALSIRCTTQLKSSTSNSKPSNSSDNDDADVDISDKWQEAIMGYENVYNPSTGQHWEAPTSSYWDTGPQGAGYYYQNGNDLTKLSRGFGSY